MEHADNSSVDLGSVDLYTRVKLRRLSTEDPVVGMDITENKRKCQSNLGKQKLTGTLATDVKNQAQKNAGKQFDVGDLVWGRLKAYPWWPGQVYNEELAASSILITKEEGCVLVVFFGDYTYDWLNPLNLTHFDTHFTRNSRQTDQTLFLKAVDEAVREFKRRAALGLVCRCHNRSAFHPTEVEGLFEVDLGGFISGGLFWRKQIEKARNDFQPDETFALLNRMALSPRNFTLQVLSTAAMSTRILFYRRASIRAAAVQMIRSMNPWAVKVQKSIGEIPQVVEMQKKSIRSYRRLNIQTVPSTIASEISMCQDELAEWLEARERQKQATNHILPEEHSLDFSWGRSS